MAEGPVSAAGNKIINNWISRKESATAIGIFSAGSPLGGAYFWSGRWLAGNITWLASGVWDHIYIWPGLGITLWYFFVSDKPSKKVNVWQRKNVSISKTMTILF